MRSRRSLVGLKIVAVFALAMVALAVPSGSDAAPMGEVAKLLASDAQAMDVFGWSVAVSGPDGQADTAVVGAIGEDARGDGQPRHRRRGRTRHGPSARLPIGVAVGIAAVGVAVSALGGLSGGAWYARRRWGA